MQKDASKMMGQYVDLFASEGVFRDLLSICESHTSKNGGMVGFSFSKEIRDDFLKYVDAKMLSLPTAVAFCSSEIAEVLLGEMVGVRSVGDMRLKIMRLRVAYFLWHMVRQYHSFGIVDLLDVQGLVQHAQERLDKQTLCKCRVIVPELFLQCFAEEQEGEEFDENVGDEVGRLVGGNFKGDGEYGDDVMQELDAMDRDLLNCETPVFCVWRSECGSIQIDVVPEPLEASWCPAGTCYITHEVRFVLSGVFSEKKFSELMVSKKRQVEVMLDLILGSALKRERRQSDIDLFFAAHCEDLRDKGFNWTVGLAYLVSKEVQDIFRFGIKALGKIKSDRNSDLLIARLEYALELIIEEEMLPSNEIALMVSMTAIEAVLTETNSGPSRSLKDFGPTLLQPDASKRKHLSKTFGAYYDLRCDVAHGRGAVISSEQRFNARRLAIAVLRGTLQYCAYLRMIGGDVDEHSHKKFVTELIISHRNSTSVVGVGDLSDVDLSE